MKAAGCFLTLVRAQGRAWRMRAWAKRAQTYAILAPAKQGKGRSLKVLALAPMKGSAMERFPDNGRTRIDEVLGISENAQLYW